MVAVLGVSQRELLVHLVVVAAPVAALGQVAGLLQVADDLCCRSLGDSDRLRDVSETGARIGCDALEDVCVVGHEPERLIGLSGI